MERKVRIISISGQPLSGKSTAINEMTNQLKNKGIKEENIHVVSVGMLFREYFNRIMELAKVLNNNPESFEELANKGAMKRVFSKDSEYRKTMLEALENLNKSKFNFEDFDIEKANNSEELKEIRNLIDTIVDTSTEELGKRIIEKDNPEEVWIFDSRIAFDKIPESFAVRLTVRDDVAGKRLTNQDRKEAEKEKYSNLEEAINKAVKRRDGEEKRYKERYNVELSNEKNYNLIIDTSFSDVKDIAETIIQCEEYYRAGKDFSKTWASPKIFLPTQTASKTLDFPGALGGEFEQLKKIFQQDGYSPAEDVFVFKLENRYYIMDGHHRLFALSSIGKTLIPYLEFDDMDEKNKKAIANETLIGPLCTFQDICFNKKNENGELVKDVFSYEDIYPGIADISVDNMKYTNNYKVDRWKNNDSEGYKEWIEKRKRFLKYNIPINEPLNENDDKER